MPPLMWFASSISPMSYVVSAAASGKSVRFAVTASQFVVEKLYW